MKVALFDEHVPGLVVDGRVIDLTDIVGSAIMALRPAARARALAAQFADMRDAIADAARRPGRPLSDVRLRAPLPRPGKILVALDNHREGAHGPALRCGFNMKLPSSILDPGGTIELPGYGAIAFHHEPQLAVVIGTSGKAISVADAPRHVLGYTAVLGVNARGMGHGLGIDVDSADGFTPMGPWIVTADEISDPQSLQVTLDVSGEPRTHYNTADSIRSVAELISVASALVALEPGDVILAGACYQGAGALQHGDVAQMTIDRIGSLSVSVTDPQRRRWPRGLDSSLAAAATKARTDGTPVPLKLATTPQVAERIDA